MPDGLVTVEIEGAEQLANKLRELNITIQDKIMRTALKAGAQVIADEAVTLAPKKTGTLADSIKVRTTADSDVSEISSTVSVGDRKAHLVEFGTAPHEIKAKHAKALKLLDGREVESVMHPGAKAHPFMRPAFDTQKDAALDAIMQVIRAGIDAATPQK
jgi:HK97 gp10 family phage protein